MYPWRFCPHFEVTRDERAAYLKLRRAAAGVPDEGEEDQTNPTKTLSQARYAEMAAAENLILTITRRGAGKLSSSHDYPVRSRGGMGVTAMEKTMRGGDIVASFPVELHDQIMLVTTSGQSIRCPINGISFRSRTAGGVRVFNTGKEEEVTSVAYILGEDAEDTSES